MNTIRLLFLLLLLSSCKSEEQPKNSSKLPQETPFVKPAVVAEIIQSTICEMVSTEPPQGIKDPTLFVHNVHVLLDTSLADELVSKGASSQLYAAVFPKKRLEGFKVPTLPSCARFKLMDLIPVTTEELEI